MATFTWVPSYSTSTEVTPKLKLMQLGDGYLQRSSDGIHPTREKWSLVFAKIVDADYVAIRDFIKANIGYSFDWTPPGEETARKFLCTEPLKREFVSYNVNNLSATFLEVFE